ncbi:hypothetical protein LT493_33650 [Streptomyces tricolor]|nr:hypothetical protein [Streptomyces tricolor]
MNTAQTTDQVRDDARTAAGWGLGLLLPMVFFCALVTLSGPRAGRCPHLRGGLLAGARLAAVRQFLELGRGRGGRAGVAPGPVDGCQARGRGGPVVRPAAAGRADPQLRLTSPFPQAMPSLSRSRWWRSLPCTFMRP